MKLHYKRLGSGEPLVVLHGLMGMLDNWISHARNWQENYDVILVDARNHGRSPWSDAFTYEAMVEDVEALLDDLELPEAFVLGHSMGGKTAMKFAQNHPERVKALIVGDIGPKAYPVRHETILAGLRAVPLEQLQKRGEAEGYLEPYIPEAGVRQFLMKSLYRTSEGTYDWRFNLPIISDHIDNVGEAIFDRPFEKPALFVHGGNSDYVLPQDREDIHLGFSDADIEIIPEAGHWLHADKPAQFSETVIRFLERV